MSEVVTMGVAIISAEERQEHEEFLTRISAARDAITGLLEKRNDEVEVTVNALMQLAYAYACIGDIPVQHLHGLMDAFDEGHKIEHRQQPRGAA